MPTYRPDFQRFGELASEGNLIPIYRQLTSDQLTPVLAYRRLVRPDERLAPSFLLESVVGGERAARYSFLGAQPMAEVLARSHEVIRRVGDRTERYTAEDPLAEIPALTQGWKLARIPRLPDFTGGWVGFAGYDTVRYAEPEKLEHPPPDDRNLPDLHFGLYRQIVAFDHVHKTVLAINHVLLDEHASVEAAYQAGCAELDQLVSRFEQEEHTDESTSAASPAPPLGGRLPPGEVDLDSPPPPLPASSMGEGGYQQAVRKAKEYIAAGDIYQVVPSQRFELLTRADPFDIYRALRVVNPSPYMFYLQVGGPPDAQGDLRLQGGMLVGSSPEILCRVDAGVITSRPLAGTRRRGASQAEDVEMERDLLADPKERAEHVMLVDLGRNDVGRVARPATVDLPAVMDIERYSHVMHLSSTVTGKLREGLSCWDALRAALPVGTVSGAPKVRAMQIIDELEPTRRGPYAGAVGYTDFAGNMDMAIALRTMVVMPGKRCQKPFYWKVHLQAGGGIVADSDPDAEHQETLNKAAALGKAVNLAECAFST